MLERIQKKMYIDTQMSIWLTGTLTKSKRKNNPYKEGEFIIFLNTSVSFFPDKDKIEKENSQKNNSFPIDLISKSIKAMNLSHTSKDVMSY